MTDAQRSQTQETDSPDTLLTVTHLRRHFGGRHALLRRERTIRAVEDVSLTLRVGETLGLVGESGCGKSTTGRMIVGLETPSSGTITFKGRDLTQLTPKDWQRQRRDVQMIFQNPQSALDPRLTIARQIREPLDLHDIGARAGRDDEVARLMQAVALPVELADRYPHQISGGQAQRVVIARALAMRPSLIVCDEPVSALDVSVQAQLLDLLRELQAEFNMAYLFVTHNVGVVEYVSDGISMIQ